MRNKAKTAMKVMTAGQSSKGAGAKERVRYCFPHGKQKALVMSYDDGSEHDRRLVEIFNKYGIRGTFNLNSGHLGKKRGAISREEVRTLYQGHEIASHTRTHPDLSVLPCDAIRLQIRLDKESLEELSGYPIRGFAYPFGKCDSRIAKVVHELGIEYARTTSDSRDFNIAKDFLALSPTCHHNSAMELGRSLIESDSSDIEAMVVWGHSYELDGFMASDITKNWDYIEDFVRMMSSDKSIWFATSIELVDYVQALWKLEFSNLDSWVANSSHVPLWLRLDGAEIEIPSEARFDLDETSCTSAESSSRHGSGV